MRGHNSCINHYFALILKNAIRSNSHIEAESSTMQCYFPADSFHRTHAYVACIPVDNGY